MKIIWHRISIQTLLFQACLPTRQNGVENRDKAYYVFAVALFDSLLKIHNLLVLRSLALHLWRLSKRISLLRTIHLLTYNLFSNLLPLAHP